MNSIKMYSVIAPAIEATQAIQNGRVFAIDQLRRKAPNQESSHLQSNPTEFSTYVGKAFLVCTLRNMFELMMHRAAVSNAYEIIRGAIPVKLYLDIEFSADEGSDLDTSASNETINLITMLIANHLRLSFPNHDGGDSPVILSACSAKKFSIHYIHPGYTFDNAQVSLFSYVIELCAFLKLKIECIVARAVTVPELILKYLKQLLSAGIIDLSVYKKNQQYRMIGNSKLNQTRNLMPWHYATSQISEFQSTPIPFAQLRLSYTDFRKSIASYVDEDCLLLSVKPPVGAPYMSLTTNELMFYSPNERPCCSMDSAGRFFVPTDPQRSIPDTLREQISAPLRVPRNHCDSAVIDDDEVVIDETGRKVFARTLQDGQIVFCPRCETSLYKPDNRNSLWVRDKGVGIPSAKVLQLKSGGMAIWCFNCDSMTVILLVGDQYGFVPECHEIIETPHKYLNFEGKEDVCFESNFRVLFLDAPMGAGKTEVAGRFINSNPRLRIISITFRISLAEYLAERWQLNCYRSTSFYGTNQEDRCVVCLDSIFKLKSRRPYDVVLIDEATFVQYHFLCGTISDQMDLVIQTFKFILSTSKKVILMQHRIPDSTIGFYLDACSVQWGNPSVVRKKLDRPVTLHPTYFHYNAFFLEAMLVEFYLKNYNSATAKSTSPFIVFTTRADHAAMLTWMVRKVARDNFGDDAENRIKGIWAAVQEKEWNKRFLLDPNVAACDADVLIVTSVLQAGHSLDCHFKTSFAFLFNDVLTYREELQFTSRLRWLNRPDVLQCRYAYIEKGRTNSKIASMKSWESICKGVSDNTETARFLSNIMTPIRSERGDSVNRHFHLHKTEHRRSSVEFVELDMTKQVFVKIADWPKYFDDLHKQWSQETNACIMNMLLADDPYNFSLSELLDNSVSSCMGDLLDSQYQDLLKGISEVVHREPIKEVAVILMSTLGEDENAPNSSCRLNKKLMPYWKLLWLLDYCCVKQAGYRGILGEARRVWEHRVSAASEKRNKKSIIGSAEAMYCLLEAIGVTTSDKVMFDYTSWPHDIEDDTVITIIDKFSDAIQYLTGESLERTVNLLGKRRRDNSNEFESVEDPIVAKKTGEAKKKNKTSGRMVAKSLLKKFALSTNLGNRKKQWKDLEKTLTVVACIVKPETLLRYKGLFGDSIWEEVMKVFDNSHTVSTSTSSSNSTPE